MPSRDECDGFRHERGVVGTSCTFWKSDAASPIRAGPDAWSSRVLFNWLAPHGYIMALLDGSEQPAPHSARRPAAATITLYPGEPGPIARRGLDQHEEDVSLNI